MARSAVVWFLAGVLALFGVLIAILGFFPSIMMIWNIWQKGNYPDIIYLGSWKFTLTQFFLINGAVLLVGLALLGVAIQIFYRAPRDR